MDRKDDVQIGQREREITFLLWLMSCSGIGNMKANLCLSALGNAETVYHSSVEELSAIKYVTKRNAEEIMEQKPRITEARRTLDLCREKGVRILMPGDAEWPEMAFAEDHMPPMLFAAGKALPPDLKTNSRALIGSLDPTERQKECAVNLGMECAEKGRILIAGMDRGVSSYAQTICIKKGGSTIAVLPCGPDICYPAEHKSLYDAIRRNGTILSLWPPQVHPGRFRFRTRDELMQALATKTVWLGRPAAIRKNSSGTKEAAASG